MWGQNDPKRCRANRQCGGPTTKRTCDCWWPISQNTLGRDTTQGTRGIDTHTPRLDGDFCVMPEQRWHADSCSGSCTRANPAVCSLGRLLGIRYRGGGVGGTLISRGKFRVSNGPRNFPRETQGSPRISRTPAVHTVDSGAGVIPYTKSRGLREIYHREVNLARKVPPPPPSRAPSLRPATVTLTASVSFNGICNRR